MIDMLTSMIDIHTYAHTHTYTNKKTKLDQQNDGLILHIYFKIIHCYHRGLIPLTISYIGDWLDHKLWANIHKIIGMEIKGSPKSS